MEIELHIFNTITQFHYLLLRLAVTQYEILLHFNLRLIIFDTKAALKLVLFIEFISSLIRHCK